MKRGRRGAGDPADTEMHRLLERSSHARAGMRPQGECLDPETLAAWTENALPAQQRAVAEAHAADCERCLTVLAAIARTSPPPEPVQRPSWFSVRWLVPVTSAAIAATAWVLVLSPWEAERPLPPAATTAIDAAKPEELAAQPERQADTRTSADAFEKKAEPRPDLKDSAAASRRGDASAKAPAPVAAPAPAAPTPPSAAASTPAQPLARAEALEERLQSRSRKVALAPFTIVSPDPRMRWRVTGGALERSTDGGETWRAQPIDPPADAPAGSRSPAVAAALDLVAGSSPAPTVCWLVGRKGTVVLSTDGESWRRLDFPEATVDLVGVTALDGRTATVTAADGRRFHTTDGGRAWALQETPATPF
ncbi:MAG TPA: hypothetical protein VJ813_11070 [Vicinamibacterales bacterium]|nr:hypothetical protein [Vicinamibacterales bacterium]